MEEATFLVGSPQLVLTELDYHLTDVTPAEQAAGWREANAFEFVELQNRGTTTADLSGVRFVEGIEFDFSGSGLTRLAPGGYVLVGTGGAAWLRGCVGDGAKGLAWEWAVVGGLSA